MPIGGSGKEEADKPLDCGIGCQLRKMAGMSTRKELEAQGKKKEADLQLRKRMRQAGVD